MSGLHEAERNLRKLFDDYGLVVVNWRITGKSHLAIRLRAPNGVEQPFTFCREHGDRHAAKNSEARVKRFARENPAPTATATAMAEALKKYITPERTPNAKGFARVEIVPPEPPPPGAVEAAASAVIGEKWPTQQPEEKTVTEPTNHQEKRLDRKQFHQLTKWCTANVPQGLDTTHASLAREASKDLGFSIAESTVKEALELEDIKLAEKKPQVPHDRAWAVACVLKNLLIELKMEVPPVLQAIVEKKAVQR